MAFNEANTEQSFPTKSTIAIVPPFKIISCLRFVERGKVIGQSATIFHKKVNFKRTATTKTFDKSS